MKKILAVLLSVLTLLGCFSILVFASSRNDNVTAAEAKKTVLEAAGVKEKDLDYYYCDHEEDFKLYRCPVWEIKFGANRVCYEYYVRTDNGEIISRYTSKERKSAILYNVISKFMNFANWFIALFAIFD